MIAGPPSEAKSAVARQLTARLGRAVHVQGDADSHFEAGFSVVVEAAVPAWSLGNYRTAIRGRPCHVVVLVTSLAGSETPHVGLWLDIAHRTPEQVVDEILAQTDSERAPIAVDDYDENWPRWFEEIAQPIRETVYDRVEHVGSTSVPGLAAKPIIDIDVVVRSVDEVPVAIERLRALGYLYQGDKGIPGREAFLWPPGARPHHLYVVVDGSPPYRDHVDLRDYLRDHPDVAREYAALKKALAEHHADDRLGYTDAKDDFVRGVLRAARS